MPTAKRETSRPGGTFGPDSGHRAVSTAGKVVALLAGALVASVVGLAVLWLLSLLAWSGTF